MTSLWLDRPLPAPTGADDAFPTTFTAHYDVIVVGAGLVGLTTALLVARSGRSVAVLEARHVGACASGNTTGKVSLLQGDVLSQILDHHDEEVLRRYVRANAVGQDWLRAFAAESGVDIAEHQALTNAVTEEGRARLADELLACEAAGLGVTRVDDVDLPYPAGDAIALSGQFQLDPVDVLLALAAQLREQGGVLAEGVRVTAVREEGGAGEPTTLATSLGDIAADHVVLATGTPILDRGFHFATHTALRSYVVAFEVPDEAPLPTGMFLSLDDPARSLRTAPRDGRTLLLVGGNGHVVGREPSPLSAAQDLIAWTGRLWPGAEPTHAWSAQDYRSHDRLPFVGELPRAAGSILVATGFAKWGLTNGVAAALALVGHLDGEPPTWASVYGRRAAGLKDVAAGAAGNLAVAATLAKDWAGAALANVPAEPPPEGQGVVGTRGTAAVAVSTVDGCTRRVSAACPHLSGALTWNDAERTWDCPLHGSRFAPDGTRLEGPATADLTPLDDEPSEEEKKVRPDPGA